MCDSWALACTCERSGVLFIGNGKQREQRQKEPAQAPSLSANLGTSCTCSLCGCAGRCLPLRNPCIGTLHDCAGRCLPHRSAKGRASANRVWSDDGVKPSRGFITKREKGESEAQKGSTRRGDVSFPTIECVPFTHTNHGNFCHPKLGLAKTSEIHSTILRTVI